jgi:hypothetical protein
MTALERVTAFCYDHPRAVLAIVLCLTLLSVAASFGIRIDTDPENMLRPDQPDRVVYDRMKRDFGMHDLLVVGIVDERGIFRTDALVAVARAIRGITEIPGVIAKDVVSLTTTDNVRAFDGLVDIRPVMEEPPADAAGLERLRADIASNPFLHEKIVSADGRAAAIYVPIRAKAESYRIAAAIDSVLDRDLLPGQERYLAGLPVAEDTFGHEMFVQMGIVAPLAFLGILLLVLVLFGEPSFLLPVALVAALSVIWTMGTMIGLGYTVHIMSSMTPVFLMPIAILDSVHILSEFHERYRVLGDRRAALLDAMRALYRPMFFTSATSAVGFGSLAMAGIPPVQVHGIFVAYGILIAWALTHTLLPALFALLRVRPVAAAARPRGLRLDPLLAAIGRVAFGRSRAVIGGAAVLLAVGVYGITILRSDDNPVRWFRARHPVRIANDVLNEKFGGTYMAHVVVDTGRPDGAQRPDVVAWMDRLQRRLEEDPAVGHTSSVADIVRRLGFVLHENDPAYDRVPEGEEDIGQLLFLFQGSGDPEDLDAFLDREGRQANVWVQMRSGDNRDMERVEGVAAAFVRGDPPPPGVTLHWSGLNHINRIWQELMVTGMANAVAGSFAFVLLLMVIEFGSLWIGLVCMVPLTVAIVATYGIIGLLGKPYDMPIAVCSSLSLGLAVDFAIHFFERWRVGWVETRDLAAANVRLFGAPARAIARNAVVIAFGFLPLLASSLTPYVTVTLTFACLMIAGALATLLLLPALLRHVGPRVMP